MLLLRTLAYIVRRPGIHCFPAESRPSVCLFQACKIGQISPALSSPLRWLVSPVGQNRNMSSAYERTSTASLVSTHSDMLPIVPRPPQLPLSWNHTPEEITTLVTTAINRSTSVHDRVGALPPDPDHATFESVVLALARDEDKFDSEVQPLLFYQASQPPSAAMCCRLENLPKLDQNVSTDQSIRDASSEAAKRVRVREGILGIQIASF
jgi:hypothetical protein